MCIEIDIIIELYIINAPKKVIIYLMYGDRYQEYFDTMQTLMKISSVHTWRKMILVSSIQDIEISRCQRYQ